MHQLDNKAFSGTLDLHPKGLRYVDTKQVGTQYAHNLPSHNTTMTESIISVRESVTNPLVVFMRADFAHYTHTTLGAT